MIDPITVDEMVACYQSGTYDYVGNAQKRNFPRGLDAEVFSRKALMEAARGAWHARHWEHVTPYIYEHPEQFSLHTILAPKELAHPGFRLCVDTEQDLELIRAIYRRLAVPFRILDVREVIDLLLHDAELAAINSDGERMHLRRNQQEGIQQAFYVG